VIFRFEPSHFKLFQKEKLLFSHPTDTDREAIFPLANKNLLE
jgi:hypothetical protein